MHGVYYVQTGPTQWKGSLKSKVLVAKYLAMKYGGSIFVGLHCLQNIALIPVRGKKLMRPTNILDQ